MARTKEISKWALPLQAHGLSTHMIKTQRIQMILDPGAQ